MTENEALALFKCLADKSRLQILKSLSREDMYVERLAERLGLTAPTVSFHLKKLSDVGAVRSYKTQYYTMYALLNGDMQLFAQKGAETAACAAAIAVGCSLVSSAVQILSLLRERTVRKKAEKAE